MAKFDPAKIPPTHDLVGVAPLSVTDLGEIMKWFNIRKRALDRLREMERTAFAVGVVYTQANDVFESELIKVAQKLGWDGVTARVFDETEGKLYGMRIKREAIPTHGPQS
jgi:hypothetical protein